MAKRVIDLCSRLRTLRFTLPVLAILGLIPPAYGGEADALAISANIRARHMPFGTILDPVFASSNSNSIVGYTRCGDSALWTGAYLAAEAFRYNVTGSTDALTNVKAALAGLQSLVDVTGNNRLARCIIGANSPYAAGIVSEESAHTIHHAALDLGGPHFTRPVGGSLFRPRRRIRPGERRHG